MSTIACVGGPQHRRRVPAGADHFTAADGAKYRNTGAVIAGRSTRFFIHDSVYNDRVRRAELTVEAHFEMTWNAPSQAGYYWVRWRQLLSGLTIMDFGMAHPGRFQLLHGSKPDRAAHRHALWSLTPIPETAFELMRQGGEEGFLIAADWCVEHNLDHHADNFRQLVEQCS